MFSYFSEKQKNDKIFDILFVLQELYFIIWKRKSCNEGSFKKIHITKNIVNCLNFLTHKTHTYNTSKYVYMT